MCDNATMLTAVLAILVGSLAGVIGGNLLHAAEMAMMSRQARREAQALRRRAHSMAYVFDSGVIVGSRVIVGNYDGRAVVVPDRYEDSGTNYRVHIVRLRIANIACLEPLSTRDT